MKGKWQRSKVGSVCVTYAGGTPNRSDESFYNGNIPWISSGEVNQPVITKTNEHITQKGLKLSSAKWIPKEAILIAMYGATAGQVSKLKIRATSNQAVLALIPKEDDDYFIYHQIKLLKDKILFLAQGSGQPNLSKNLIDSIFVSLPQLKSQRKIAKILNTADAVIEKTEAAIAKYKAIKQGMMQDLFTRGIDLQTGQLRPAFKDTPHLYKETELGWIPKEWGNRTIGEIGSFRKGNNIPKSILSLSGVGCIVYGQIYTTYNDNIYQVKSRIPLELAVGMKKLKKGDILFAGSGETHEEIGKCISYQGIEDIYPGGDIVIISLNENQSSRFFGYYLNHYSIRKQKAKMGQGSSVIHIYSNHLRRIAITVPHKKEQLKITDRIEGMDNLIEKERANLAKHQSLKKGLMQDLLTGKVEVEV